ncbi:MAG TPA: adenylate/guanylate cyclase domain-containing protein [Acidimicrobiales bacterium]|nr:adenylate/guanylate cyclase domain-containing protein [Acidimicrobiales bacterium]
MSPKTGRAATATPTAEEIWGAIVFTDIVGFTQFTALEGDEQALALLDTQERLVNDALPTGARVVKELGDGLLLWFPDGESAITTTLDLQCRFEAESSIGMPLWVRMGVHCGKALVKGTDLVGHDVNVAARILDVAGPGEVLVSDQTRADVAGRVPTVAFDEIGPVVMKGIPEPVRLWRATRL